MNGVAMDQASMDARWAKWKLDGVRMNVLRKARFRKLVAALCLGGALWVVLQF
jgi:hypothetical protein